MIFVAVGSECNIGCAVVISRLFGTKEYGKMKTAVSTTVRTAVFLAVLLTGIGVLFNDPLMRLIRTPDDIFSQAALYLRIYIFGFPFLFLCNIATGLLCRKTVFSLGANIKTKSCTKDLFGQDFFF